MVSQSLWQRVLVLLLPVSSFMQLDCIIFYQLNLFHGHSKVMGILPNVNIRLVFTIGLDFSYWKNCSMLEI